MTSELKLDEGSEAILGQGDMKVTFNASGITVNVRGATITIDKHGSVAIAIAANDTLETRAAPEIGDIERDGEHKGEIYGGIWSKESGGDNQAIWFSAAPRLMDHYAAAAWATEQGGSLPSRQQGKYLTTLKGKGGALTEFFNRGSSFPDGYVWLKETFPEDRDYAWYQSLSKGGQYLTFRAGTLPVLSVRR